MPCLTQCGWCRGLFWIYLNTWQYNRQFVVQTVLADFCFGSHQKSIFDKIDRNSSVVRRISITKMTIFDNSSDNKRSCSWTPIWVCTKVSEVPVHLAGLHSFQAALRLRMLSCRFASDGCVFWKHWEVYLLFENRQEGGPSVRFSRVTPCSSPRWCIVWCPARL